MTALDRRAPSARLVSSLCVLVLSAAGFVADAAKADSLVAFEEAESSDPVEVRSYEVGELLRSLARQDRERMPGSEPPTLEQQRRALASLVQVAARTSVQEAAELPVVHGDRLVVRTTATKHREIAELLQLWQQAGLRQIAIEIRFITASPELLRASGLRDSLQTEPPDSSTSDESPAFGPLTLPRQANTELVASREMTTKPLPARLQKLTDAQTRRLIEVAQGDSRTNLLQAPRVTAFNGQSASIADGIQRPFVTGTTKSGEAQIRVLHEGTTIHWRAVAGRQSDAVRLQCRVQFDAIGEIETREIESWGDSVTIQIPKWHRATITANADLELGESILIGGAGLQPAPTQKENGTTMFASWRGKLGFGAARKASPTSAPQQLYLLITPRIVD